MNVEIQKLTKEDTDCFSELIKVFKETFEWKNFSLPTNIHLQKVLKNKSFLVFVAKQDQNTIGGLTAHVLERYDLEKPSAYIYDIAVLPKYQRKGIGKLLIEKLNNYYEKKGVSEVFVQSETDDQQALNFYRTTPNTSELQATHFTYSFNQVTDNGE